MTLKEKIMKLQTYKMYEDEDTVYVERDDVLKTLEQIELNPSEDAIGMDAVIEWLKNKDIIKLSSQEEIVRKELKELLSVTLRDQQPCDTPRNNLAKTSQDCISRAEVLECAYLLTDDEGITHEVVHADDIRYAAPVTWCGWTPATQPPEPNTAVLLYVKYKSSGQWTYQLGMWNDSKQTWEDWRTPYDLEEEFEIIEWMETPER